MNVVLPCHIEDFRGKVADRGSSIATTHERLSAQSGANRRRYEELFPGVTDVVHAVDRNLGTACNITRNLKRASHKAGDAGRPKFDITGTQKKSWQIDDEVIYECCPAMPHRRFSRKSRRSWIIRRDIRERLSVQSGANRRRYEELTPRIKTRVLRVTLRSC